MIITVIIGAILTFPTKAIADDHVVYSVYNGLNMGNENEIPRRDFYINMGDSHGVKNGMVLEVLRKTSTYDLLSKKLYKDMIVPIAKVKVIHTESQGCVARLLTMNPLDRTPAFDPYKVLVGDLVRIAN